MPVKVEFKLETVKVNEIDKFDELKNAIILCKEFWTKNKNEKTVKFFEKAVNTASQDSIKVLRISDFNTTGLTGSKEKYNTPWQNLVKSSGVSDKSGSSGGSFGIGKSAPFVCSELRTIIYSTLDCEGIRASQGVARLVSFENQDILMRKYITQGIGYYGNTEDNSALKETISFGSFHRTDAGTDVYIIGFTENYEWADDVIKAILDGFLISIINNDLTVTVDTHEINSKSLPKYIEKYREKAELAYNYYQALTSDKTIEFSENFMKLGKVTLKVLLGPDLKRRVLVTRKNGMKIFDKDRISGTIYFAGILMLEDENINSYFREMETPQHDDWQPYRHSKPAEAKKYKAELFKWVKNNIFELGKENITDETDAEGMGDYIPDEILIAGDNENTNKSETLEDKTKSIEISEIKNVSIKKGFQHYKSAGTEGEIEVPGFYDEENENGKAHIPNGNPNDTTGGAGTSVTGREDQNSNSRITKNTAIKPMGLRLYMSDYKNKQYTLIFSPEKSAIQSYVKLSVAGEQSNIKIPVKSAHLANITSISLPIKNNKILLGKIIKKTKIAINFEIEYDDTCSMEVNLYGIKI